MHSYELSEQGKNLANDSGLEDLAELITQTEATNEQLFDLIKQEWGVSLHPYSTKVDTEEIIGKVAVGLHGLDEMRAFTHGLEIDPKRDNWRYLVENSQPTLFPSTMDVHFKSAIPQDRLIESGVVGSLLERYSSRFAILQREKSKEYGFANQVEANAFIGALMVGKVIEHELKRKARRPSPTFKYREGNIEKEISVSITSHGDFQISLTEHLLKNVISPAGTSVQHTPETTSQIAGYHSIEPDIVCATITDVYVKDGRKSALEFITELEDVVDSCSDNTKEKKPRNHNSGDVKYSFTRLKSLIKSYELPEEVKKDTYFSIQSSPQSGQLFEILPNPNGLRFQQRNKESKDPKTVIDIPRTRYGELFKVIFIQAQNSSGSPPQEHIGLINNAKKLLLAISKY